MTSASENNNTSSDNSKPVFVSIPELLGIDDEKDHNLFLNPGAFHPSTTSSTSSSFLQQPPTLFISTTAHELSVQMIAQGIFGGNVHQNSTHQQDFHHHQYHLEEENKQQHDNLSSATSDHHHHHHHCDQESSSHQSDVNPSLALLDDNTITSAFVMPPISSFLPSAAGVDTTSTIQTVTNEIGTLLNTTAAAASNPTTATTINADETIVTINKNQVVPPANISNTGVICGGGAAPVILNNPFITASSHSTTPATTPQSGATTATVNLHEHQQQQQSATSSSAMTPESSPGVLLPPPQVISTVTPTITTSASIEEQSHPHPYPSPPSSLPSLPPPPPPPTFSCVVVDAFPVAENEFNDDPYHQSLLDLSTSLHLAGLFREDSVPSVLFQQMMSTMSQTLPPDEDAVATSCSNINNRDEPQLMKIFSCYDSNNYREGDTNINNAQALLERIEKQNLVRQFHTLCEKDFDPNELESESVWVSRLDHRVCRLPDQEYTPEDISYSFVIVVNDQTREVVGGATVEYYHASRSALLGYVVVGEALRGKGFLSKILNAALEYLRGQGNFDQLFIDVFQVSNNTAEPILGTASSTGTLTPPSTTNSSSMLFGRSASSSHLVPANSDNNSEANNINHDGVGERESIPSPTDSNKRDPSNTSNQATPTRNRNNNTSNILARQQSGIMNNSTTRRSRTVKNPKHHLVFRDEFAEARQKIWGKLGFLPFNAELLHPGDFFHGRYQLACYGPLARETWAQQQQQQQNNGDDSQATNSSVTISGENNPKTSESSSSGSSASSSPTTATSYDQQSVTVNVPLDTISSFISTYFHSCAVSSCSSTSGDGKANTSAQNGAVNTNHCNNNNNNNNNKAHASHSSPTTNANINKKEGETEIKVFLHTLVQGSTNNFELSSPSKRGGNLSLSRMLRCSQDLKIGSNGEIGLQHFGESGGLNNTPNNKNNNRYEVKSTFVAPSFVCASKSYWK